MVERLKREREGRREGRIEKKSQLHGRRILGKVGGPRIRVCVGSKGLGTRIMTSQRNRTVISHRQRDAPFLLASLDSAPSRNSLRRFSKSEYVIPSMGLVEA